MSRLVLTADDAVPASSDVDDAVADVAARVNALYAAEALDDDVAWRVSVEDSIELDLSRDTLTYGEISVSGLARALRAALDLAGPEGTRGQEVFYDLGCGRGVATLAAAALAEHALPRGALARCVGIELLPSLVECGRRAESRRARLAGALFQPTRVAPRPDKYSREIVRLPCARDAAPPELTPDVAAKGRGAAAPVVEFWCDDLLEAEWWEDATVVYACATRFEPILAPLADRLLRMRVGARAIVSSHELANSGEAFDEDDARPVSPSVDRDAAESSRRVLEEVWSEVLEYSWGRELTRVYRIAPASAIAASPN